MKLCRKALLTVLAAHASTSSRFVSSAASLGNEAAQSDRRANQNVAQRISNDRSRGTKQFKTILPSEDPDEALLLLDNELRKQKNSMLQPCSTSTVRGGRLGDGCPAGYRCTKTRLRRGVCTIDSRTKTARRELQDKKKKKNAFLFIKRKNKNPFLFLKKKKLKTGGLSAPAPPPPMDLVPSPSAQVPSLSPSNTGFPTLYGSPYPSFSDSEYHIESESTPTDMFTIAPSSEQSQSQGYPYMSRCFTGSAAFIQARCNADARGCCTGDHACEFRGTNVTVCPGACSGNGACLEVDDHTVVLYDSCVGEDACRAISGVVRARSCLGGTACRASQFLEIGGDACTAGDRVCAGMNVSNIGVRSCRERHSCEGINVNRIGEDSCRGAWACRDGKGESIRDSSCHGRHSCARIPEMVTIGSRSCIGDMACFESRGSIGDDSCQAGSLNATTAYVCSDNRATIGDRSCNNQERVCANTQAGVVIGDDTNPTILTNPSRQ